MAKVIFSFVKFSGNLNGLVFVDSKKYGLHVRTVRGSKKPAPVNKALLQQSKRTAILNSAAKRVHDPLSIYYRNFKDSQLWPQLHRCMRQSNTDDFADLLAQLNGLEINGRYSLERFGSVPVFEAAVQKQTFTITMYCIEKPALKKNMDCYYYELGLLLFCKRPGNDFLQTMETAWVPLTDKPADWIFAFKKPVAAEQYLIFLGIHGGDHNIKRPSFDGEGMRIVGTGSL